MINTKLALGMTLLIIILLLIARHHNIKRYRNRPRCFGKQSSWSACAENGCYDCDYVYQCQAESVERRKFVKTPDEIKKGLTAPIPVHYHHGDREPHLTPLAMVDLEELHANALALIQQLQAENAEKDQRIQQLEAERDAAVADLSQCTASHCPYCKHWDRPESAIVCINCRNGTPGCKQHFEWRGIQKEE